MDWTINELVNIDTRTRKMLAMCGCLRTRSNVARLYLLRKEGKSGLIGIEECVKREIKSKSFYGYLRDSTERMLQMVLREKVLVKENLQDYQRRKEEKVMNLKEKTLHEEFFWQTSHVAGEESWRWLRNGFLRKSILEQALRTNSVKHSIDKTV